MGSSACQGGLPTSPGDADALLFAAKRLPVRALLRARPPCRAPHARWRFLRPRDGNLQAGRTCRRRCDPSVNDDSGKPCDTAAPRDRELAHTRERAKLPRFARVAAEKQSSGAVVLPAPNARHETHLPARLEASPSAPHGPRRALLTVSNVIKVSGWESRMGNRESVKQGNSRLLSHLHRVLVFRFDFVYIPHSDSPFRN